MKLGQFSILGRSEAKDVDKISGKGYSVVPHLNLDPGDLPDS